MLELLQKVALSIFIFVSLLIDRMSTDVTLSLKNALAVLENGLFYNKRLFYSDILF